MSGETKHTYQFVNGCDGELLDVHVDEHWEPMTEQQAREVCAEVAIQDPGLFVRAQIVIDGPGVQYTNGRWEDGDGNAVSGLRELTDEERELVAECNRGPGQNGDPL